MAVACSWKPPLRPACGLMYTTEPRIAVSPVGAPSVSAGVLGAVVSTLMSGLVYVVVLPTLSGATYW